MAEFGVGFKLFADASQFQRELKEATESAKNVQRGLKDIGVNIGGLLGIGAVTNAFLSTVNAAQKLRDEAVAVGRAVDGSVESVAKLGDSLDALKTGAQSLAINTLGVFTKLGDSLGNFALRLGEGLTQAQIDNNAKISSDAEKNIAKMAAARENYATKLAEADEKLAKAQRENAIKRAGDEEKLAALLTEQARIQEQLAAAGKNTVKARELQIEAENNITAIVGERDRIAKKAIEDEAKAQREIDQARKQSDEQREKAQARIVELKYNALSADQKIAQLTREEKDLVSAIAKLKAAGQDYSQLEVTLLEKQAELSGLRLNVEKRLSEESEKQAKSEAAAAAAAERRATAVAGLGPIRGSSNFSGATDEALKELIQQNRALAQQIVNPARGGGAFNRGEAARLEFEARNAESEIRFRESLQRDVAMFGVEGARRNFKGDPLAFDSLLQRFVTDSRTTQEIQKEQTDQLRDLNARLSKFGFTK